MTRLLLVVIVFILVACDHAFVSGTRNSKTRTISQVIKEVAEIKEILKNTSETEDGKEQWKASYDSPFAMTENEDFSFGVLPTPGRRALPRRPPTNRVPPLKPGEFNRPSGTIRLPVEYDSRQVWGERCPSFNHVAFQGSCGNCWSVAVTSMINDRTCQYKADGEPEFFHSARHLTTCLRKGCDGGWFPDAFDYWIHEGIPSGGDYRMNQPSGCKAYPSATTSMKGARCEDFCDNGTSVSRVPKSHGGARYEIRSRNGVSTETEIMAEIFMYGPLIATFDVYDDLAHYYKRGVYRQVSRKKLGGHATKLLGWGVENGVKFWYAANSWGKDWGDGGFFKIQRGVNECNIESNLHAAVPAAALHRQNGN